MNAAVLYKERPIQVWEWEGGAQAPRGRPPPIGVAAHPGARSWTLSTSEQDVRTPLATFGSTAAGWIPERKPAPGYPKLKNDGGVREIRIGAREFECIGAAPPHDHPHVHIDMGSQDTILCPYCSTRYRIDDSLSPMQAEPADSLVTERNAAIVAVDVIRSAAAPRSSEDDARAVTRDLKLRRKQAARSSQATPAWPATQARRPSMFGYQGGEDEATVARKREHLKDAQKKWPFLTNLDASTIKGEGQLVDLVRTRISLSEEQAASDVRAWMQGKQF
jgi:uncharacterized Zn-finger protein